MTMETVIIGKLRKPYNISCTYNEISKVFCIEVGSDLDYAEVV